MNANQIRKNIFILTNRERLAAGLKPFVISRKLSSSAYSHAIDMAKNNFFKHSKKNPENIAAGFRTAKSVVEAWMASPGHRRNILNPAFNSIGIGFVFDAKDTMSPKYKTYFVQQFGSWDAMR